MVQKRLRLLSTSTSQPGNDADSGTRQRNRAGETDRARGRLPLYLAGKGAAMSCPEPTLPLQSMASQWHTMQIKCNSLNNCTAIARALHGVPLLGNAMNMLSTMRRLSHRKPAYAHSYAQARRRELLSGFHRMQLSVPFPDKLKQEWHTCNIRCNYREEK